MIKLEEGNPNEFNSAIKTEMESVIKHFERELAAIRTGRASTSLVEDIKVEVYGQFMPMKEVATISAPDARLITIQPWDKSNISEIEKAIQTSDIGINPANDGNIIRLQLPMMSSDRREEMVKQLGKKTEENRIRVRNIRKEFHNLIRDSEKKHDVSEDFSKKLSDLLQKGTDSFIAQINEMQKRKEADLKLV
jgi:ribosome recycling factor